jgi:hypothetical protein
MLAAVRNRGSRAEMLNKVAGQGEFRFSRFPDV